MNITPIVTKTKITSNVLLRDISRRSSLNRMYERQTLELLKKSIEERKKTYSALSKRDKEGGGLLGNILGGSLLQRLTRGRGPKGRGTGGIGGIGGGGPRKPITPRGGGGGLGRLGRLGKIGPLAILGTGLDFAGRKALGQTNIQAGIGAGGGLAGALGGAKLGAALGTAILPGVGTAIGGIGGSIIGGLAGGSIADLLTRTSDTRREKEIQRISEGKKSKFSFALDRFDRVINNFEGSTTPLIKEYKENRGAASGPRNQFLRAITSRIPKDLKTPFFQTAAGGVVGAIAAEVGISLLLAFAPVPGTRVVALARIVKKIPVLRSILRILLRSRRPAQKLIAPIAARGRIIGETIAAKAPKTSLLGRSLRQQRKRGIEFRRLQAKNEKLRQTDFLDKLQKPKPIRKKTLSRSNKKLTKSNEASLDIQDILGRARRGQIKGEPPVGEQVEKTLNTFIRARKFQLKNAKTSLEKEDLLKAIERYELAKESYKRNSRLIKREQQLELGPVKRGGALNERAEGGPVEAGQPYIVGELGKELFVPDVSGNIVPNDQLGPPVIIATSDPDTITKTTSGGGSSGGGRVIVPASPFDVVAKYAQMTGLFTV